MSGWSMGFGRAISKVWMDICILITIVDSQIYLWDNQLRLFSLLKKRSQIGKHMYKVQSILDKRIEPKTKKQQYLIKWEGYELEVSTWEPIEHLEYCLDLVDAFEKNYGHLLSTSYGTLGPKPVHKPNRQNKNNGHTEANWQKRLRVKEEVAQNVEKKIELEEEDQHKNEKNITKIKGISQSRTRNRSRRNEEGQAAEEPELGLQSVLRLERQISRRTKLKREKEELSGSQNQSQNKGILSSPINIKKKISKQANEGSRKKRGKKNPVVVVKKQHFEENDEISKKKFNEEIYEEEESHRMRRSRMSDSEERVNKLIEEENMVERQGEQNERVKILGMRRTSQFFQFYLEKGELQGWATHSYIIKNYPRELCLFYEQHIEFD